MHQYRLFKWNSQSDLICLSDEETEETLLPGEEWSFEDVDGEEKDWIVSEVLVPNPKVIVKPNGTKYYPDPIVILKPKE